MSFLNPGVSWDDKEIVVNVKKRLEGERKIGAWGLVISIWCLGPVLLGIVLAIVQIYFLRFTDEKYFNYTKDKWTTIAKNKNMDIRFINFPDSIKHLQSEEDRARDPTKNTFVDHQIKTTPTNQTATSTSSISSSKVESFETKDATAIPMKTERLSKFTIFSIVGLGIGIISIAFFSWFGPVLFINIILLVICLIGAGFSLFGLKGNKIVAAIGLVLCGIVIIIKISSIIMQAIML